MADTLEYKTISATTEKLALALQHHLVSIGGTLVSRGVITPDQYAKLRNKMYTEAERAADLVEWIQAEIKGDNQIYHTLVEVLQQNPQYAHILATLQDTYTKLQRGIYVH